MRKLLQRLRDWNRGYTDRDVETLNEKWLHALAHASPGAVVALTQAENHAMQQGRLWKHLCWTTRDDEHGHVFMFIRDLP